MIEKICSPSWTECAADRKEESGIIYYTICFYEGNCKYSIRGQERLDELKGLANSYWDCVKNNL